MSNLTIGCNFSKEHVDTIITLAEYGRCKDTPSKITAVYGSPAEGNPFGSVRPTYREVKNSVEDFKHRVERLRDKGIKVYLTLNSTFPHLKAEGYYGSIFKHRYVRSILEDFVKNLEGYVDAYIIAHPRIIELFHDYKFDTNIILSTVMNVHSLMQLKWIKENWPRVIRICPALWMNRDFRWLKAAQEIIPLELLVNEFCTLGGAECEGIYRQSCYLAQSMDTDWNPMFTACIESRIEHPEAWLMARFILPQWVNYYQEKTGVEYYKITGRTHPAEYINYIGTSYVTGKVEGNLLELWGQLEATYNRVDWKNEQNKAVRRLNIPIEEIVNQIHNFRNCSMPYCGVKCVHCKKLMDEILTRQTIQETLGE